VVLATLALARDVERGPRDLLVVIAVGCAGVWAFTPFQIIGVAVIGLWIAIAVLGGFGRPAVAFVIGGAAPALLVHAFTRAILWTGDSYLHDTYVDVGAKHAIAAVIGFAALAGVAAWTFALLRREPVRWLAWIGACVCSSGALLHALGSLRLGMTGMPRRYWDYDPAFTAAHRLAGVGAGIAMVGLVVIVLAWALGRRPSTS
jgi:hypothetical protein